MGWWSDTWKEITSGGKAETATYNSPSSNNSQVTSTSTANANSQIASGRTSMLGSGSMNIGGKQTPTPPANAGNPPVLTYTGGSNPSYTVDKFGLDGSTAPALATNANGSLYYPDPNNLPNVLNTVGTYNLLTTGDDSNMVLPKEGGGYTTIGGRDVAIGDNYDPTGGGSNNNNNTNTSTSTTTTTSPGGGTPVAPVVNQALLDALALRDAALARQLGVLNEQFSFSTQDYYDQLGTDYREGGLSDAFSTAYDDATRGIYDTFKSAGMLTQEGVDDKLGILAGAEGGEEGRIDSIVDQYTGANKNYVTGGHTDLSGALQGLAIDSEDVPTINAQTAAINAFDVIGKSQPYKEPTETEVVDFFTDFVKRSYDPSYNVDPSAVATGAPKRVTGSVNQKGANTAPSTIAGLFDPVTGGSVRVVS